MTTATTPSPAFKTVGTAASYNGTFCIDAIEKDGSECRYIVHASSLQSAASAMSIQQEFGTCQCVVKIA